MIQQAIKQEQTPSTAASSGSRRRLRPVPNHFSCLDVCGSACRPSEASRDLAAELTISIGPETQVAERYLGACSYVPHHHLDSLRKRKGAIVMAPTIPIGLDSKPAADRRGRTLTASEYDVLQREYGPQTGTVAVYDPLIRSLVLPTGRSIPDPEHPVLHEFGHALTWEYADGGDLSGLRVGLPPEIAAHISLPAYRGDARSQVAEILAEAYAWIVVGRWEELPVSVVSALMAMLPDDVATFEDPL